MSKSRPTSICVVGVSKPLHKAIFAICFFELLLFAGCKKELHKPSEPTESSDVGIEKRAYLSKLNGIDLVTVFGGKLAIQQALTARFADSSDHQLISIPKFVTVKFTVSSVIGHADLAEPARCLVVQVDGKDIRYGIYSLWKDKSTLEMPLPTQEASVTLENVTAESALLRLLHGFEVPSDKAKQLIEQWRDIWFGPGLRAIILAKLPNSSGSTLTLFCFEAESD